MPISRSQFSILRHKMGVLVPFTSRVNIALDLLNLYGTPHSMSAFSRSPNKMSRKSGYVGSVITPAQPGFKNASCKAFLTAA